MRRRYIPPIMDWLNNIFFPGGNFLGIEWHVWKVIGWMGNITFTSRFFVQWYYTEKMKQVVVPVAFWWLSLTGASLLFAYAAFFRRDSVFIFAYVFTFIPYIRNLIIHHRHLNAHNDCPDCGAITPPKANYCAECGCRLKAEATATASTA